MTRLGTASLAAPSRPLVPRRKVLDVAAPPLLLGVPVLVLDALLAAPTVASAEEVQEQAPSAPAVPARKPLPEVKQVRSSDGSVAVDLPKSWIIKMDAGDEKLIYGADMSDLNDFVGLRVEKLTMDKFLRDNGYIASKEDMVADEWSVMVQEPITPNQVAKWLMGGSRSQNGGQQVETKVVDVRMEGDTLLFHAKKGAGESESFLFAVKSVLRKGTIATAYCTAKEARWQPGYTGQIDGGALDSLVETIRLLPPK